MKLILDNVFDCFSERSSDFWKEINCFVCLMKLIEHRKKKLSQHVLENFENKMSILGH